MLKKSLMMTVFTCMFVVLLSVSTQAQVKFGYVSSVKILATYKPALDAQKTLDTESQQVVDELKQKEEEFLARQSDLEKQSMLLSDAKKKEKAQELQNMYVGIQRFQQEKQQEMLKRREDLLKPVYDEIDEVIQTFGDREGYDYIMDSVQGSLVYAKPEYDITDKILAELEKKTPGSTKTSTE